MIVQVDLTTLATVLAPLITVFFCGLWALLHHLLFKPLGRIFESIGKIRDLQIKDGKKIAIIETKIEYLEETV